MAKTKNKNDIKKAGVKRSTVGIKNNAVVPTIVKKPRTVKKKLEVVDEVKKKEIKETGIVERPTKKSQIKKELSQEEIIAQRKERNRKKYQNQQKKYQDAKKTKEKKVIEVEDKVVEQLPKINIVQEELKKEVEEIPSIKKEEDLIKKITEVPSLEKDKEKERKEKRKTNHKAIQFTHTLTTIKEKSVTRIYHVKQKVDDNNIPVGKSIEDKNKRSKRIIKEAIFYAIVLTIINVICITLINDFNFLRLFDVKWLNVIVTIIISLIFNFFVAFMIDYFITEIWLNKKRKKRVGDPDGNNRTIEGEYKENIPNQEGK